MISSEMVQIYILQYYHSWTRQLRCARHLVRCLSRQSQIVTHTYSYQLRGAMNSLGAGGAASPNLINAANALTFCLMVVSCYFGSVLVHYIGIKWALVFGTLGYAPFAAGLYTNNRFGNEWFVLFGAALCGISAGVFWMAEAAIAISYPEPWNRGKALGYWLTYRLGGQILGGAINLGINSIRNEAGKVGYTVYLVFIALQVSGAFVALLLNPPDKVQRTDGKKVNLIIAEKPWFEIKATTKLFFSKHWLLFILFIGQAVFAEAVYFTYLAGELAESCFQVYVLTPISMVHCASSCAWLFHLGNCCCHCWKPTWLLA